MDSQKCKSYSILFTGVGRRVELLQAFRQAAKTLSINIKLHGADVSNTAPALAFCDYVWIVCGMQEIHYLEQLLKICQDNSIDLLVPTIDTDLIILSNNIEEFEKIGTKVLISKPEKVAMCRDKMGTARLFQVCGLKAPCTVDNYRNYTGLYPCFIKPKDGSSSINAFKIESEEELKLYADHIGDYIVQPFIEGTEYTVDIFCDYDGNPIFITPRIRLAVRSGEVLKTKIVMDEKIIAECIQMVEEFKPCGPITVQLIRDKNTDEDYFIEINPRFGGGVSLSIKAGARSPEVILKFLSGVQVNCNEAVNDGAVYSRFDQSVCIFQGKIKQPVKGVIFDLDDTLYPEKQYVSSGYKAVAKLLGEETYADRLWKYFERGSQAIDELLIELDCLEKKEECLKVYREHMPKITLYEGVSEMIQKLRTSKIKVGIITDGRVLGQKNKIIALGLNEMVDDIIITDELGGVQFRKPCDIAFRILQCKWGIPFEQLIYVGDNMNKDFFAPKVLGMVSILVNNENGLYYNKSSDNYTGITVKNISEVIKNIM